MPQQLPKERPILFSGPMVRAILEGRKTQTRRVVKPQPSAVLGGTAFLDGYGDGGPDSRDRILRCPYGAPGDRLWVREAFALPRRISNGGKESLAVPDHDTGGVWYCADLRDGIQPRGYRARPSIHMPRWASRLTLEIVSVRVERLQEISGDDACQEGIDDDDTAPEYLFSRLWDTINGKRAPWASNPWVWVIQFRRLIP